MRRKRLSQRLEDGTSTIEADEQQMQECLEREKAYRKVYGMGTIARNWNTLSCPGRNRKEEQKEEKNAQGRSAK